MFTNNNSSASAKKITLLPYVAKILFITQVSHLRVQSYKKKIKYDVSLKTFFLQIKHYLVLLLNSP